MILTFIQLLSITILFIISNLN